MIEINKNTESVLSYVAMKNIPNILEIVKAGDIIGGLIFLIFIILIWLKGQKK